MNNNHTPVMQQYFALKEQHADCLLFYRLGDFYELFFDDAIKTSKELQIVLTKRGAKNSEDIPMCGFPHHSADQYIKKLIKIGHKIAICEQMETPEEAKKNRGYKAVVRREVVKIITPGTITDDNLLEITSNNYLMSIVEYKKILAISYLDISTGLFSYFTTSYGLLADDLARISPSEIIISESLMTNIFIAKAIGDNRDIFITSYADNFFDEFRAHNSLKTFYKIQFLDSVIDAKSSETIACGALIEYLSITQKSSCCRIDFPKRYSNINFMSIDTTARHSLELMKCQNGEYKGSFSNKIDLTITAVGSRLLKRYINSPLFGVDAINNRLDIVTFFHKDNNLRENVRALLKDMPDFERSLSRISLRRELTKDLHVIKNSLILILKLSNLLVEYLDNKVIKRYYDNIGEYGTLMDILIKALSGDIGANIKDGGVINPEYDEALFGLYNIRNNGNKLIAELCMKYRKCTGINNLKISHNNVLGYFIEVTPQHASKIHDKDIYIHRQTLASSLRYTTGELKEIESKIITSKDQSIALEVDIITSICNNIIAVGESLSLSSSIVAELDCLSSFAEMAFKRNYVRPFIDSSLNIKIEEGRHPMLEEDEKFVSNDLILSEDQRLCLLTGPNMSGKSTYLRQNALIIILAQIGSFVPAKFAHIGVVDKVFSRVGAMDSISTGKSTFMVEMVETATILNNASSRSFVLMDEVGRGTSLYDGLSIAWAVVEHIHNVNKSRGIFATHYHELSKLENTLKALSCYCIKIREWDDKIIFLYKIIKGISENSYGLNVAKLAGVPMYVVERAKVILKSMKKDSNVDKIGIYNKEEDYIVNDRADKLDNLLDGIDIDNTSPREAWDILHNIIKVNGKIDT